MKSLIFAVLFAVITLVASAPQFFTRERPSYEVGFDRNGRPTLYQERPSIEYYGGNFVPVSNYRPQVISSPSFRQNNYRRF